jgi:WD40 repeat protein
VGAVAVLPDGRVVSGGDVGGRVRVWDPAAPEAKPAELGRHDGPVGAVAVLPDGRVVSGGNDQRVRVWDPAAPEAGPAELGRHDDGVGAVAVLPDGRVVSGGGDQRVLLWDVTTRTEMARLGCSVTALATGPNSPAASSLVIAHAGGGFSLWSYPCPHE